MIYESILLSEIKNNIKKKIYCFGAGKAFDAFKNLFANYQLEEHIKAIVDNNANALGVSVKNVNKANIPIISLQQMLREIKEDDHIIITTASFNEVVAQLEKIQELNCIRYSIYSIIRIEQYDHDRLQITIPDSLSTYNKLQIPKVIHYCWFGKKKIPDQYKKWMESWKRNCPDYEIVEWNESNYDIHKNKFVRYAYERGKWAFVSDYARVDIVNQYGGVYLDTDVELIRNIDNMLKNDAFCGFESSQYINYGLGFGAKKGNNILDKIKQYYEDIDFTLDDEIFDHMICPIIQTKIMKKHGLICNGEFQIIDGMTVYPSRILCGMSPISFRIERNPALTYAIHHFEGSWVNDENKQMKNLKISNMKKWGRNGKYIYSDI